MFLEKKGNITENNEGERKLWIDYITIKKKQILASTSYILQEEIHLSDFRPSTCQKSISQLRNLFFLFDFVFLDQFICVLSWEIDLLTW